MSGTCRCCPHKLRQPRDGLIQEEAQAPLPQWGPYSLRFENPLNQRTTGPRLTAAAPTPCAPPPARSPHIESPFCHSAAAATATAPGVRHLGAPRELGLLAPGGACWPGVSEYLRAAQALLPHTQPHCRGAADKDTGAPPSKLRGSVFTTRFKCCSKNCSFQKQQGS